MGENHDPSFVFNCYLGVIMEDGLDNKPLEKRSPPLVIRRLRRDLIIRMWPESRKQERCRHSEGNVVGVRDWIWILEEGSKKRFEGASKGSERSY